MPNKNEVNRGLVEAFNSILRFDGAVITNLTVEKDHIVISFDKNMDEEQCMNYLNSMKEKVIERFCIDESAADESFHAGFFPFNFDKRNLVKGDSKHRFLVSINKEVISNLKYLLANELVRCEIVDIMENHPDLDVEGNMFDRSFDKKSYLHCICFDDQKLQKFFVDSFSSKIKSYENGPKKLKDFLEERRDSVYIKQSIFDDPKFIKDIVMDKVSSKCRDFQTPSSKSRTIKTLKFLTIDLIRKALPCLPIDSIWHASHKESKNDFSILAPIVDCGSYIEFLDEKEVDHINNKVFGGTKVLSNVKNDIAGRGLLTFDIGQQIHAIDFFNPDIAYCVMNKVVESSVINKDHKLSIDPALVPVMKPQTLVPPEEVGMDEASGDSGFHGSPKRSTIRTKNADKFLGPDYCGEGRCDASAKDSGIGASSARSSFDKPNTTFNQPSVSQPDQCSAKKRTSISKSACCIL